MNKNQINYIRLAGIFNDKAGGVIDSDPALTQKIVDSLSEEETNEMANMEEALYYASVEAQASGRISPIFARLLMSYVDKCASLFSRAMEPAALYECLPPELRNDESANYYATHGAPHLAKICAFKPE